MQSRAGGREEFPEPACFRAAREGWRKRKEKQLLTAEPIWKAWHAHSIRAFSTATKTCTRCQL